MTQPDSRLVNALTIDVEDYFQVSAFAPQIARSEWDSRECRVERNVNRILELLDNQHTQATFFTLGWIAERYPQLVRQIVAQGHELASHGYAHERASDQSAEVFYADIQQAKTILEDLSGQPVIGYRAPSFSIGSNNLWAFDCLARAGYRYSSSIYLTRSTTTITACPTRHALPIRCAPVCKRSRSPRCACSSSTCPPVAAAISGCCPMRCRAGCCARSMRVTVNPAFFTFTRGKSTPISRAWQASA